MNEPCKHKVEKKKEKRKQRMNKENSIYYMIPFIYVESQTKLI